MANKSWKNKQTCHLCDRSLIKADILQSHYAFTIYQNENTHGRDFRYPRSAFFNSLNSDSKVYKTCLKCFLARNPLYYKYGLETMW